MDMLELYEMDMLRRARVQAGFGYRTADLVLHLDGIQNTRSGKHNPTATVWEDLTGNIDITLYNATWGADHAAFTGADDSYGIGAKWAFAKGTTIEIVFKREASSASLQMIAGWSSVQALYALQSWIRANNSVAGRSHYTSFYENPNTLGLDSFVYAAGTLGFSMINGAASEHTAIWVTGTTGYSFRLAAYGTYDDLNFPGYGFPGSIYAVRVYDANLTIEELYAHWLIDKARFNIPEA